MTRREAAEIIARIVADEIQLDYSDHARERFSSREYSPHDLRAILRCHEMEAAPKWSDTHQNDEVSLLGKCLEGRPTRVMLGLRQGGPCVLITIMIVRDLPRRTR